MSNVLIGIIGVILFIGVALAGALFLGDRFSMAANSSKASTMIQQLQQAANAASLYEVHTGSPINAGAVDTSPIMSRYLKTAPQVLVDTGGGAYFYDAAGEGITGGKAVLVGMVLKNGKVDREICEAVQRHTGQIGTADPFDGTARPKADVPALGFKAGCMNIGVGGEPRFLVFYGV